jgi:hypothetical protein
MELYRKGCKQILQAAHIQQGDLILIQTATKELLKRKGINWNYIVGKGLISARAAIRDVAKMEARKRPKKKLILDVSDKDSSKDNSISDEYETLHPELRHWDNRRLRMLAVPDPFRDQQDEILFN